MATLETVPTQRLGEHGEPCAVCGTPLAGDQRYCLNCGTRRADPRLAFDEAIAHASVAPAAPPAAPRDPTAPLPPPGEPRGLTPLAAVLAVSAVVLALGIGVILGRGSEPRTVAAPRAQVITVGGTSGAATAPTAGSTATFTSDWPAGTTGFTVQLRVLPKRTTNAAAVTAAKSAAAGQGASAVGALDSDDYASLAGGHYVIYSGVFKTRALAAKALKRLKADFPAAKVIAVSTTANASGAGAAAGAGGTGGTTSKPKTVDRSQLQNLQNASPEQYEKQSKKLPDVTAVPGTPPPTDNKAAGGGGDATVIG